MIVFGIIGALACLLVIMNRWSEGMFEASEAIILALVFCGLIFGLFAAQTWLQALIVLLLLVAASVYMAHSFMIGADRSIYKRECEQYAYMIRIDPRNWGAREKLADTFYKLGKLDRAIEELQAAVDVGAGHEARYKLSHWTKEQYMRDTLNPVCKWCQTENAIGDRQCTKCGSELPFETSFARWISGGRAGGGRIYLMALAAAALTGISILVLPLRFAFLPVGCAVLGFVGWALLASARN